MTTEPGASGEQQGLRRELRFVEAIALSLAIMAPTAAMALNGTAVAGLIGRAVPLAFLIATIGVMFVSYGFVRLTRYFNSAGLGVRARRRDARAARRLLRRLRADGDLHAVHGRLGGGGRAVRPGVPRRHRRRRTSTG